MALLMGQPWPDVAVAPDRAVLYAEHPSSEAEALFQQGLEYYYADQFAEAIQTWQRALLLYPGERHRADRSVVLTSLAAAHLALGDYRRAVDVAQQAASLAQAVEDAGLEAQALGNLGIAYRGLGLYEPMLTAYQRALELVQRQGDRPAEAHLLELLGNGYEALGEYSQAQTAYQQSLAIAKDGDDSVGASSVLANLGALYSNLGDTEGAITAYRASLMLAQITDNPRLVAHVLHNLGAAYHSQGNLEAAQDYYQQSLTLAEAMADLQLEAQALGSLGLIYADQGNLEGAIAAQRQSLALAQSLANPQLIGTAQNNLGHTLFSAGRLSDAEIELRRAIHSLESLRPGLTDAYNVSLFDTHVLTYNLLQQILVAQGNAAEALVVAERGRARAFVELLAGRQPPGSGQVAQPPTLAEIRAVARRQNATLVAYSLVPEDHFKGQGRQRGKPAELYLWVVAPTGEITFRRQPLAPLLDPDQSLVDLVTVVHQSLGSRGQESNLARGDFVRRAQEPAGWAPYQVERINPDGTATLTHPEFTVPGPVPIAELYRVEPAAGRDGLRPGSDRRWQQLYEILIAPIADALPDDPASRVILIPQDQLFLVPFAALTTPQGKPLIEGHTLLVAPSIQVLNLVHQAQPSQTSAALIVGNPSPMPAGLSPLPYAEQEARQIAQILQANPLTGAAATVTEVQAQLPQAGVIHLATHGFFNEANPLQGAIALAPTLDPRTEQTYDGFLTAETILGLSLRARLVVLSACDTGRGQITGDGVIGLSRAFMAAGSSRVLVSLWPVPDDTTAALMVEFYRAQQQGLDYAAALRQAMLTTRQRHPDPSNWAAFTLIGPAAD
jgi:tetratricopeptide (TPR) repeat protein